jgi:competence protein ComEC
MCSGGWFAYRRFPPSLPPRSILRSPRRARLLQGAAGLAALSSAIVLVSLLPLREPGEATFALLDTEGTSTLLVTTPHGQHVLVNAGPTSIIVARELGAVLPHWQRSINAVVLLGADADESGGLAALARRYAIQRTVDETATTGAAAAVSFDGVTFIAVRSGPGAASPLLGIRVTFGETSLVVPAAAAFPTENSPTASLTPADVLVVAHGASRASDIPLVRAVDPAIALIPVGTGEYDPSPAASVLGALSAALTFRTDEDGRITLHTDGRSITFATAK